jgi:hypothetical protein
MRERRIDEPDLEGHPGEEIKRAFGPGNMTTCCADRALGVEKTIVMVVKQGRQNEKNKEEAGNPDDDLES